MLPFTNRKYPVLDIHEIDQTSSGDSLSIRTEQLTYNVCPVYSSKVILLHLKAVFTWKTVLSPFSSHCITGLQ